MKTGDIFSSMKWADVPAFLRIKDIVKGGKGKKGKSYGWYANVVWRKRRNSKQLYMKFIGQSVHLHRRRTEHKLAIKGGKTKTYHYRVARLPGNLCKFFILGEVMDPKGKVSKATR